MAQLTIKAKGNQYIVTVTKFPHQFIVNSTKGMIAFVANLNQKNIISRGAALKAINQVVEIIYDHKIQIPFKSTPGANRYCQPVCKK